MIPGSLTAKMASAWTDCKEGQYLLASGALIVVLFLSLIFTRRKVRCDKFPKGPPGWPIVGHLPLLRKAPHQVLAKLCRDQHYGPIMGLRLGSHLAVVVSSADLAKEVLLTQDKIFANRPHYRMADELLFGYNNSVGFCSYNPRFSSMRKVYTQELFVANRLQQLQHIRQDEVRRLLRALMQASNGTTQAVDLGKHVTEMAASTLGRQLHSDEAQTPVMPELIEQLDSGILGITIGDFFPWLRFLDFLQIRRMRAAHRRMVEIIDSMLLRRRQAMTTTPANQLPLDFLQVILSRNASVEDPREEFTDAEIKSIICDILLAGIHAIAAGIVWAMAELLRKPACMQKARKEIEQAMQGKGPDQLVKDEDVTNMPYLEKVMKEVLRLHPAAPMLVSRISSEECRVGEYILPKGTHVNVWAIMRDPLVWEKPTEFAPERFDGKEVDVKGQHFEFLPFGSGRRACPGMRLALSVLKVTVANLLRTFDWEIPADCRHESLNMSESGDGMISLSKATPILVIPKLRLQAVDALLVDS